MKAIIHGLRYDTEKAILVGKADQNGPTNDFRYWQAGLYKTPRSGRFFLAGHGGPMTRWSRPAGNMTTGGSGIHPLTHEDALEWAEQFLSDAEVEAGFSTAIEDA
jgi:hypothetical protein